MARAMGVDPTQYGRYEEGTTQPPHILEKVAEVGKISHKWLLTGEGGRHIIDGELTPPKDIPLLSVIASGGFGKTKKKPPVIEEVGRVENKKGVMAKEPGAFCIVGESMKPLFKPGTYVVVDRGGELHYAAPAVYKMRNSHEILCKFCVPLLDVFRFYSFDGVIHEVPKKYVEWAWPVVGTI